jgi:type I restriction enzyme S subunit
MKKGWEIKRLPEIAEYFIGLTYSPKDVSQKGTIVLRSSNIQNDELDMSDLVRVARPVKEGLIVRKGDILMCSRNGSKRLVGKTALIGDLPEEMTFGTFMTVIRGKSNPYLAWFFKSHAFREQIGVGENTMINQVTKYMLDAIRVPLPTIEEQRRIVGILDEAFVAIDIAKSNTERSLDNVRELFVSRLRESFSAAWKVSEIVPLSELTTDITDGDHLPPPKSAQGVPFITIGNISKDSREIDFTDTFKVPGSYFARLKNNRKPKKGDVLYTVTGSFGIPVLVKNGTEFCFQRHIALVRPKHNVSSQWLYYLFLSPQLFRQADDGATGAAQRTVSLSVLRRFQVPNLPLAEQNRMVETFVSLQGETRKLETSYRQELAKLNELKNSILDRAFSGQLA